MIAPIVALGVVTGHEWSMREYGSEDYGAYAVDGPVTDEGRLQVAVVTVAVWETGCKHNNAVPATWLSASAVLLMLVSNWKLFWYYAKAVLLPI